MNYTKVKANLEKLRAKFTEFQDQFNADGFVDAKEQKILNELLAEIQELEEQVEVRVSAGAEANLQSKNNKKSKEEPVMFESDSAPERAVGAGSRFAKSNKDTTEERFDKFTKEFGGAVSEEEVEQIAMQDDGVKVAGPVQITGGSSNIGAPYHPSKDRKKAPRDPNPLAVQAANLVYEALWAASRTLNSVLALTTAGSLTLGSGAVTAEHGTFITPDGEVGLVTALGKSMSIDGLIDVAEKLSDKKKYTAIEQLLIHTMEGAGGSLGFTITVIFGKDKGKLGGQAFTVGGSKQFGIPSVAGNVIFATESDYLRGLRPIGINVSGSFNFPPAVKFDINIGEAVAKLRSL